MATNFYAELQLSDKLTYEMHIGKQTGPDGITIYAGKHFGTITDWSHFLRQNQNYLTIRDGSTTKEYEVEDFIQNKLIGTNMHQRSQRQIKWLKENDYTIHNDPVPTTWESTYWIDHENGLLFSSSDFS